MQQLGNLTEDQVIDFKFSTVDTDNAPITISSGAVSVYKANGTTESTAGVTLTTDFDSRTGLHHVRIDTSADAFYAAANDYQVVLTGGTVDGISVVGTVLAVFSIENRFKEADVVMLGGDAQSLTDLKDFADAGYDPATNKVEGVKLADTATNVTNNVNAAVVKIKEEDVGDDAAANWVTFFHSGGDSTTATLTTVTDTKARIDNIFTGMELDGSVYRWTTNALEQAPSGPGGGGATAEEIRIEMDANSTKLAAILDDTGTTGVQLASGQEIVLSNDALDEMWSRWMATVTADAGASTYGRALHYTRLAFSAAGKFSVPALENAPAGEGAGGTSQPRINRKPDPGFTIQVSRRTDGTYKCTRPIRLTAGAVQDVYVFIDMSPLFGPENYVQSVGEMAVSEGSITEGADKGPRDTFAVLELDGTADDNCEITVPVTMTSGTTVPVVFDVEVLGE